MWDLISSNSWLVMVTAHYCKWPTCIPRSHDYCPAPLEVSFLLIPILKVWDLTDYHVRQNSLLLVHMVSFSCGFEIIYRRYYKLHYNPAKPYRHTYRTMARLLANLQLLLRLQVKMMFPGFHCKVEHSQFLC